MQKFILKNARVWDKFHLTSLHFGSFIASFQCDVSSALSIEGDSPGLGIDE